MATFSKSNPADVAVSVALPDGVTIEALHFDEVSVSKANKWGYSNKTLTLKQAYLAGFENGEFAFDVIMSNGDTEVFIMIVQG